MTPAWETGNVNVKADPHFKTIVGEALARAAIVEPPVSMEAVAASLGIPVRRYLLPSFFRAALVAEDGMPVVLLNAERSESMQRDALAHVLAHVLLVLDGREYPREYPDHTAAEGLAKELILPTAMVKEQAQLWFNDYRYLARMFAVGESDMLERMQDLGLVRGPQGIMWDY
jgi:Zn-dependent peptidase ImmA (M78 family)